MLRMLIDISCMKHQSEVECLAEEGWKDQREYAESKFNNDYNEAVMKFVWNNWWNMCKWSI